MRTKQFIYLCSVACLMPGAAATATAQIVVEEVTVAELVPGKTHYYEVSNLDNWYLSAGAGTQTLITEDTGSDALFTLAMNVAAGKWITPFVGMRMSAMAGSLHYDWEVARSQHNASMRYGAFYFDFMWEMTNSVFGFDERRLLSVVPFVGLGAAYGWHHTGTDRDTWAMPVTGGIKFNFRLSHYIDFFVEGRVQAYADAFNNMSRGSQIETAISAIGGITVKFRESRFHPYNPAFDRMAIAELNNRTNQLRAELNACKASKKPAQPCPPCPEVPETTVILEPNSCTGSITASVSFAINSATVSQREMVNVYNVAQWLKENPDCDVTITGYADRATGSAEYNMKLSRRRAQAVADALKTKYGISTDRIHIVSEGSSEQPFPAENDWNRIVIFTGGEM